MSNKIKKDEYQLNKNLLLQEFLFSLLIEINKKSEEIYKNISVFLQEQSHSFGFKPLSDLHSDIIEKIDLLYGFKEIDYFFYENVLEKKKQKKFISLFPYGVDKQKELLKLVIYVYKELTIKEQKIGKIFSKFLTENQEDNSIQSFFPLYELKEFIIRELDRNIYKEKNHIDEDFDDTYGIWYCYLEESECGSKKNEFTSTFFKNILKP